MESGKVWGWSWQEVHGMCGRRVELVLCAERNSGHDSRADKSDREVLRGVLYCVDPVTHHVMLCTEHSESAEIRKCTVFPGRRVHSLMTLEESMEGACTPLHLPTVPQECDRAKSSEMRERVLASLSSMHIDVSVVQKASRDGSGEEVPVIDVLHGAVLIYPPYTTADATAARAHSEVVLRRVRHVLASIASA